MPTEIITSAGQLAPLVEKLGVLGLLLIGVAWLIYERQRLMKLSAKTYRQRDMARQILERYRSTIVAAGIDLPNTDDIHREFAADAEDK